MSTPYFPETITTLDALVTAAWERGMTVSLLTWSKDRRRGQLEAALRLEVGVMQQFVTGAGGEVRNATVHDEHVHIAEADTHDWRETTLTLIEMVTSVVKQANQYLTRLNQQKIDRETFKLESHER